MDETTRTIVRDCQVPNSDEIRAQQGVEGTIGTSGSSLSYLAQKALRYGLVFLVIATMNFALPRLMPGDPLVNLLGEYAVYDTAALERVRTRLGLDGPLHLQYWRYLGDLVRGEWGYSYTYMRPVSEVLATRLRWTLLLILPSVVLGVLGALVLGTLAGWRHRSRLDTGLTALALLTHCMPHHWLAMLALMALAFHLDLFPLGRVPPGDSATPNYLLAVLWHLTLPLAVVTVYKIAYDFVIVRNSVITVGGEDHVLAARARGVATSAVMVNHVVRNSLAPLVTITALQFGNLLAGALLVEVVFSWPGMGTLIYDAIGGRDYPLLQASFVLIALCVLFANFLADVLYATLDPRVR